MKLALIFLSIFVAVSHQQFYLNPRMMFGFPWLAVPPPPPKTNIINYPPQNIFDTEVDDELVDTQSRIKGISRPRPSLQDDQQQNARFLFNLFATTTGAFNNPLLKTATFTSTQTLSLVKIVNCVPANQLIDAAPACRRKRRDENDDDTENHQFTIAPSETLGVMPTALSSSHDRTLNQISSSDDYNDDGMSTTGNFLRDKRFFINKNQFLVSSTLTTFAFVNTTQTVTVNLLNPVPPPTAPVPCKPVPYVPGNPPSTPSTPAQPCVNCLPAGYIVCPTAG